MLSDETLAEIDRAYSAGEKHGRLAALDEAAAAIERRETSVTEILAALRGARRAIMELKEPSNASPERNA